MKNIFKSKKFIIAIITIITIAFAYIYYQKDIATVQTGSMIKTRHNHETILMNDGRVLVFRGSKKEFLKGSLIEVYVPKIGKFQYVGNINEDITYTAILLQNNQILFVGTEYSSSSYKDKRIPDSEIYDPTANKFVNVGRLHYPKSGATLTLLPNGKVLVMRLNPELYDPKTTQFTLIDKMLHSELATTIQLANGNVLIDGPISNQKKMTTKSEIYDYKKNKFIYTLNNLKDPSYRSAISLRNGKVLFTGSKKAISEIYDSKTNSFHQINNMNIPRFFPKMVLLKDGRVLILGGESVSSDVYGSSIKHVDQAEIFDPEKETFTLTGKMNTISSPNYYRGAYTATLLPSGKVLIAGGTTGAGLSNVFIKDIELYDPVTGIFTRKKMRFTRMDHTATLLKDGRVLIIGGENETGILNNAEIYKDK